MMQVYIFPEAQKETIKKYKNLNENEKRQLWDNADDTLVAIKSAIKSHYLKVQNFTCSYCFQKIIVGHHGAWDTEHIISKDGYPDFMFEPQNLCISCKDCNGEKSNKNVLKNRKRKRFPRDKKDYLIVHPHFDVYDEHIRVVALAEFYLPLSEKGRFTVEVCGLLRFVRDFAGYKCLPNDVAQEMTRLNACLMAASGGAEQHVYLCAIADLAQKAAAAQRAILVAG